MGTLIYMRISDKEVHHSLTGEGFSMHTKNFVEGRKTIYWYKYMNLIFQKNLN